ncbi:MAG: hypothetical protein ABR595_05870, partial [Psychroflexus sp.]
SIVLMSNLYTNNSIKTLLQFSNIISEYLNSNHVILYYYCDTSPINMRGNRKKEISPQHYRSKLFSKIFQKGNFDAYIEKSIRISDPENGNHFTSIISLKRNQKKLAKKKLI